MKLNGIDSYVWFCPLFPLVFYVFSFGCGICCRLGFDGLGFCWYEFFVAFVDFDVLFSLGRLAWGVDFIGLGL